MPVTATTGALAVLSASMSSELAIRIEAMSPDEFERLVFELVDAESGSGHQVQRLRAPDGGADVLLLDKPRPLAYQAKHYRRRIDWRSCESSLEAAVAAHAIRGMCFVFPRDLTRPQAQELRGLGERHPELEISSWTVSRLEQLLGQHEHVRRRFFGPAATPLLERLEHVVEAGMKLEDGVDLVRRARLLGDFAAKSDPEFDTQVVAGSAQRPPPEWPDPPYVQVTVEDEEQAVTLASWSRPGAAVPQPTFGFTDDKAGERARMHARVELAHGRDVVLREGVYVEMRSPAVLRELSRESTLAITDGRVRLETASEGGLRISAGDPVELELVADPRARALVRKVSAYPVLAERPGTAEVAAIDGGMTVHLTMEPGEERVDFELGIGWAPAGGEARQLKETIEFIQATRAGLSLSVGMRRLVEQGQTRDDGDLGSRLAGWAEFCDDLLLIEERTGSALPVPEPERITEQDADAVATASDVLRRGAGVATFERGTRVVPYELVSSIAEQTSGQSAIREVVYEIFGRCVSLGNAEYVLPPLKLVDVRPAGRGPFPPARVWLEPAGDGRMAFRLLAAAAQPASREDAQTS